MTHLVYVLFFFAKRKQCLVADATKPLRSHCRGVVPCVLQGLGKSDIEVFVEFDLHPVCSGMSTNRSLTI